MASAEHDRLTSFLGLVPPKNNVLVTYTSEPDSWISGVWKTGELLAWLAVNRRCTIREVHQPYRDLRYVLVLTMDGPIG